MRNETAVRPANPSRKSPRTRLLMPTGFAPILNFDLEAWFLKSRLSPLAEEYVRAAMVSPSRHLSGYFSHTIHYPCAKFGHTLKFESRNYSYPFGLQSIYRQDVLFVLDEPGSVKINLPRGGSRKYTPDLLVLTEHQVEVYETRGSHKLAGEIFEDDVLYHEEGGRYRAPLVEALFAKLGFRFQIITEREIHSNFVQAANDLHPYITGTPKDPITDSERESFLLWVEENPGRRLGDMAVIKHPRRFEIAQYLIAQGKTFTSLSEIDLQKPENIRLYPTPQDEAAFHLYLDETRVRPVNLDDLGYRLRVGSLIEFEGTDYKVVKANRECYVLQAPDGKETPSFSKRQLLDLKPRIGRFMEADKLFEKLYHDSDLEYRLIYAARMAAIAPYRKGGALEGETPKNRTARLYWDRFRRAESEGRSGHVELFPKLGECGRKPEVLRPEVQSEFKRLIDENILHPIESTPTWVWSQLSAKFSAEEIGVSKRTIFRRISLINIYYRRLASRGKAGAADHEGFFGDSPTMGSPHGRRAFQRAHLDSSPVDAKSKREERQWTGRMVDGNTNKVLAWHIYKNRPTAMTIRAVLLNCVERYGALPAEISTDWGSEHQNTWLQKSVLRFGVVLDYRPKKQPRKGGPVESSFGADCRELWDNLPGHLKHSKSGRLLSKALEAKNEAILSGDDLIELHDAYCYLRNERPGANTPSPQALEQASFEKYGSPPCQCPVREEMEVLLLPFVAGIKRKVCQRGMVRCNRGVYGIVGDCSPLLEFRGKWVEVRWIPENDNMVYVCVPKSRRTIACYKLKVTRSAPDVIARATEIDAAKSQQKSPAELGNDFIRTVNATIGRARERKRVELAPKVVPFKVAKESPDDEVPVYDWQ